jgi:DNA repair protein RecN (Recombination protein N)
LIFFPICLFIFCPSMIRHLQISNYILIDKLELDFQGGLNIITGETGAGKSILMGALDLISGERADPKALRMPDQKCIIEAWFAGENAVLDSFFQEEGIENEGETIIRREILPGGKSRAFVNDSPVTLDVLKKIGGLLLDIHGQQDTQLLGSTEKQLEIFDLLAKTGEEKKEYRQMFQAWQKALADLKETQKKKEKEEAEFGYRQFVFEELEKARLQEGEQESMEKEASLLRNAEDIQLKLHQTLDLLEGQSDIPSQMKLAYQSLEKLGGFSEKIGPTAERLKSIRLELADVLAEIKDIKEEIQLDPERLLEIEERLSLLYTLQKKHRKENEEGLLTYFKQIGSELESFQAMDDLLAEQEKLAKAWEEKTLASAQVLSKKRKECISEIENKLHALLADMALEKARFQIAIEQSEPGLNGSDKISFLFSANPGKAPADLKSVASGGEFSRLMLAMKALLAQITAMPTLIFDEIDTGISGEVAMKVGLKIKEMARFHQVFAITHSAQMASQADTHWLVYKSLENDKTTTEIKCLTESERLDEIAKMISGSKVGEAALQAARDLVMGHG